MAGEGSGSFNFDYHRSRDWHHYEVYLKRFRGKPSSILEMGSGVGLFLDACRHNNIEAIGVEYELEGVDESKGKGHCVYQHDLSDPLSFFDDQIFDAVFSNQVIEHLPKKAQENMVEEAFRLLKPGGQLLIISPCRHWEPARQDVYHISLLTPSELRHLVESKGFVDCNMGYNRCSEIPEIPADILSELWIRYMPDLFSKDATVLAYKTKT